MILSLLLLSVVGCVLADDYGNPGYRTRFPYNYSGFPFNHRKGQGPPKRSTYLARRISPRAGGYEPEYQPKMEPKMEEPKMEEPKMEEPKMEEPKMEVPKMEEPKYEEPKMEEPKMEEPKMEELKKEEPKYEPKIEPKVEPKIDAKTRSKFPYNYQGFPFNHRKGGSPPKRATYLASQIGGSYQPEYKPQPKREEPRMAPKKTYGHEAFKMPHYVMPHYNIPAYHNGYGLNW